MPKSKKPDPKDNYILDMEEFAVEVAKKAGVAIRIERDTRGRYHTLTVRAVGLVDAEPHVVSKIVDGVRIKEGK